MADCFGANPVASALGNRPGRDPSAAVRTYHEGPQPTLRTGTFYLAGNRNFLFGPDTRYVTALREGGSLPAIVEADDLGLYVLKFRGAGQGPAALVAELIAGEIGRTLGVSIPELVFVTRHGCEPWADLAVKLMLKWPNLYYSTSAFAPKYYPKAIVDYANTRGAHEVIYAGYSPMGLSLERILGDMPGVPFRDDVWPKFLRENARRVLGLDGSGE